MSRVLITRVARPPSAGSIDGFPDAGNTGFEAWPSYTELTPYAGPSTIPTSGALFQGVHFSGQTAIGTALSRPSGVTFRGCLFEGSAPNLPLVQDYGYSTTFEYCTFRPPVAAPPVSFAQSYQFGINHSGQGLSVRRCHMWGFGNAVQLQQSSAEYPVLIEHSYMHDAADQANAIYHHDGILSSNGGPSITHITIRGNTIVSGGNTNGIALQVDTGTPLYYSDITITGNLVGGWGATINVGGDGAGNQRVIVTDNTVTTLIAPVFRELYGWSDGGGNLWRRNRWHVPPSAAYGSLGDTGKYWTPTGVSSTDWTG